MLKKCIVKIKSGETTQVSYLNHVFVTNYNKTATNQSFVPNAFFMDKDTQ